MSTNNNVNINVKINSDDKKIKDLNKAMGDTQAITKDLSKESEKTTEVNKKHAESLLKVAQNLTTIGASIAKISFDTITDPLAETGNKLKNFAIGLGATATAVTAVETIIAKNLLSNFTNLNDEMANVNSVLLESDQGFNRLSEKVRDLSLNLKLATETEIAKGLYDVGSAGFSGADGITVLDTAIKASKAGRADLKESSSLIAGTLNGLALGAENAEYVTNILFKTIQRGVLTFSDLSAGLGDITAILKSLEQPLEVAGAALSLETRKGTTPAKAITNLNSLLLSFSAQSEQSKKKALELGLQMDSNAVKTKGFAIVLEEVVMAARNTGDLNGTLFTLLGRQEALNAALQLSNAKEFKKEIDEMKNSSTALSDSLAKQTKSLSTQFKEVQVQLSGLKTEAGGLIGELAGKFLPIVSESINEFNSLSESGRKNILIFAGIVASIPAVVAGFGAITLGIGLLVAQLIISRFLFQALLSLLSPLTTGIVAIAGAMKTAAISAYSWATGTTTANTALLSIRATLTATVATLGAFVAILSTAAIAVGLLTVEIIKLDQAQEAQRKNEQRNYDTQAEAIKTINTLRDKERQGFELTAKEQEAYAKALISMGDSNKILREEAQKRIKKSKELAIQEKDQAKAQIGFTDEEMKKRNELFQTIKDHEIATKNEFIRSKEEAKKQLDEDLKALKDNLKAKIITEEEYRQQVLIINSTFNSKIKNATDKYNEEVRKQREEKLKKQEEYAKLEQEIQSNIQRNTLSSFEFERKEAERAYQNRLKDIQKQEGDKNKLKLQAEKEYQSQIKKINEDERKQKLEDAKKDAEELKRFNEEKKSIDLEYSDFIRKIQTDLNKIGASESEKARIDLKENLLDIYRTYENIKEKMSSLIDPKTGKKKYTTDQIKAFSDVFSETYKALEKTQNQEINKIDFGSSFKTAITSIEENLNNLSDNEDLLRGQRLDQERTFWNQIKSISEEALKFKDDLSDESIKYYEDRVKESSKNISKTTIQTQKLQIEGLKNVQNAVKDITNEFGLFDNKLVDTVSNLLDFKNTGLEASQSLIDASSELTNNGFSSLMDFAKKGGDLTGIKEFFDLAISQSQKMFDAFKDNMREINNFNDFAQVGSDIGNDLANTFTGGLTGKIGSFFGLKTTAERKKEAIDLKELQLSLIKDRNQAIQFSYDLEIQKVKESSDSQEMKTLKLQKLDQDYFKQKEDQYNQEKELSEKLFNDKISYALEINRLNHKLNADENDQATNAILQAQDNLLELEATEKDLHLKELKRLEITKDLQIELNKIKENGLEEIGKLMNKYYDLELENIKKNHNAEYDLIRLSENKIKENQTKIDSLNAELDRINAEFDKRLQDPNLSAEASKLFTQQRQALIGANNGIDLNALVRTPVDEFERKIAAQKEQIDLEYSQTGNLEKRSEALKKLAVEQNVYWSELAKTLVKGTKEYDNYIKNANDGFRDFKSSVKDSIEVQKQNTIQSSKLETQISSLTDENKKLQSTVTQANLTINKDVDNLTAKFKSSTGEWITDINKARQALQGISTDSTNAINSLNKIQTGITKASTTNVNNITATSPTSTPVKTEALANFSDALPNETMSAYIARVTREDAAKEQQRLSSYTSSVNTAKTNITSGVTAGASVASNISNNTGWFDKGGSLGWINPMNWFSEGGIANGAESGYPAMLHGKELILNSNQADNMAYILKMANSKPSISSNNSSIFAPNIYINGSNLDQNQLKTVINNVLSDQQRRMRSSYGAY